MSQIVRSANRLAIELDDRVSRLQACEGGGSAGDHGVNKSPFEACGKIRLVLPLWAGRLGLRRRPRSRCLRRRFTGWLAEGFQSHAEVGAIDTTVGPKLIGHPERIVSRDRKTEVIVSLGACPIIGRDRNCQPASDQAQQLAAKVGHDCAAIAGIQRRLYLDQPTELCDLSFRARSSPAICPRLTV